MESPVLKAFEIARTLSGSMIITSVIIISIVFAAVGFKTKIAKVLISSTITAFVLSILTGALNALYWMDVLFHSTEIKHAAKNQLYNPLFLSQGVFYFCGLILLLAMSLYRIWRKRKKTPQPRNKMDYNF